MNFFISSAHAAAPAAQQPDTGFPLIMMIVMFVIFYFLLIRPQQKRAKEHQKLVSALAKGDEVVTSGGIMGKITNTTEQYVTVEIAANVQVRIQRHAISAILPKGSIKAAEKD
ncbi:MAG: preprotein translocase subunit YajC [Gammaproteobacteria bacterium]|nr:preprotein translocase subunit YajC [Gammaproteobacteria bacterium]MDH5650847.1 preprotein translocase subunit YajC [Gammaproteobacteria bacterium]